MPVTWVFLKVNYFQIYSSKASIIFVKFLRHCELLVHTIATSVISNFYPLRLYTLVNILCQSQFFTNMKQKSFYRIIMGIYSMGVKIWCRGEYLISKSQPWYQIFTDEGVNILWKWKFYSTPCRGGIFHAGTAALIVMCHVMY